MLLLQFRLWGLSGVYAMLCVIIGICIKSVMSTSSTTELYMTDVTACGEVLCINGEHQGLCRYNCSCAVAGEPAFRGDGCEEVLFHEGIVEVSTSARTANFTWQAAPGIAEERYWFVYRQSDDMRNDTVGVQEFSMINDTTARLTGLQAETVSYTVCLTNSSAVDKVFLTVSNETCLNVVTKEGGIPSVFTTAAIAVGASMSVCLITLFVVKLVLDSIKIRNERQKTQHYSKLDNTKETEKKSKKSKEKKDVKDKGGQGSVVEKVAMSDVAGEGSVRTGYTTAEELSEGYSAPMESSVGGIPGGKHNFRNLHHHNSDKYYVNDDYDITNKIYSPESYHHRSASEDTSDLWRADVGAMDVTQNGGYQNHSYQQPSYRYPSAWQRTGEYSSGTHQYTPSDTELPEPDY